LAASNRAGAAAEAAAFCRIDPASGARARSAADSVFTPGGTLAASLEAAGKAAGAVTAAGAGAAAGTVAAAGAAGTTGLTGITACGSAFFSAAVGACSLRLARSAISAGTGAALPARSAAGAGRGCEVTSGSEAPPAAAAEAFGFACSRSSVSGVCRCMVSASITASRVLAITPTGNVRRRHQGLAGAGTGGSSTAARAAARMCASSADGGAMPACSPASR